MKSAQIHHEALNASSAGSVRWELFDNNGAVRDLLGDVIWGANDSSRSYSASVATHAPERFYTTSPQPNVASVVVTDIEPTVGSSHISAYRIAALFDGGSTEAEVAKDFPSLGLADIRKARKIGKNNPAAVNKYPKVSLKRMLLTTGFGDLAEMTEKKKRKKQK